MYHLESSDDLLTFFPTPENVWGFSYACACVYGLCLCSCHQWEPSLSFCFFGKISPGNEITRLGFRKGFIKNGTSNDTFLMFKTSCSLFIDLFKSDVICLSPCGRTRTLAGKKKKLCEGSVDSSTLPSHNFFYLNVIHLFICHY